ncbi:hypothetical protein amb4016 [Paramagnetospirillum magneticum AMB-1]|uniref:Uncharacterized protein n=1 Tax=Paramagnetospirillum magneticum (strain ATCC 700264 / AMB-1) TaxID=342108 RepID=Q2W005_PARM1|nr:hypothetical protein amb4016 [Paramagnetospirillum magneticum AMB-1]
MPSSSRERNSPHHVMAVSLIPMGGKVSSLPDPRQYIETLRSGVGAAASATHLTSSRTGARDLILDRQIRFGIDAPGGDPSLRSG